MSKEQDILDLAAERFKFGHRKDMTERNRAGEDLLFFWDEEGSQWDEQVRRLRENQKPPRPCLTINKLPEKVDRVEGEFQQLEPSFKVRAIDSKGDIVLADIIAGMLRHIEYVSSARDVYNAAHTHVLICGRGAWRIDVVECEEDPFVKELRINPIGNVFSVVVDAEATKKDKSDMTWCFVTNIYEEKTFKAKYPGVNLSDWPSGDQWTDWRNEKGYRVAEYWWKEEESVKIYRVERQEMGRTRTLAVETADENDIIVDEKTVKRPKVRWCELVAGQIIDGPHDWPGKFIPIIYEIGKEINLYGESKTRGMIRYAKEPQRLYNYWSSSITEQVALAPKVPYLLTGSMIAKHQSQWDEMGWKNFNYLLYDADEANPQMTPRREAPPPLSPGMANELARQEHDISSAMGIYAPSLGDVSNERSGRAIYARQSQGSIGTFPFTKNFSTALLHSCRVLIDLIPHVYDTERIIRIIGEDEEEYQVPVNMAPQNVPPGMQVPEQYVARPREGITRYLNDLSVGKYDVAVSVGPSYTTLREEALAQFTEMAKVNPQLAMVTMDLIVDNMDIPKADVFRKRVKKLIPPQVRGLEPGEQPPPPPPPPPELVVKMQELQLKQQEQHRKDMETAINAFKAQTDAQFKLGQQQMEAFMGKVQAVLNMVESHQNQQQIEMKANQPAQPGQGVQG